jgi:purine-binding chemotaxis protein CheW
MSKRRRTIDWDEVKRRLEQSPAALERALGGDAERLEAVYRKRAEEFARRGTRAAPVESMVRVLAFNSGTERFAVEFADVAQLLPLKEYTSVPGGPRELLGVVNVHGEIRSVVDLCLLLGLPGRESAQGGYVLLLRRSGREVALRVDSVDQIIALARDEVVGPAPAEERDSARYVKGLAPGRLRLLDTDALLAHAVWQTGTRTE